MELTIKDEKNICKLIKAVAKVDPESLAEVDDFDDLIQAATNSVDYGDFTELCDELGVSDVWLETYFEYDENIEDYHAKRGYYFVE